MPGGGQKFLPPVAGLPRWPGHMLGTSRGPTPGDHPHEGTEKRTPISQGTALRARRPGAAHAAHAKRHATLARNRRMPPATAECIEASRRLCFDMGKGGDCQGDEAARGCQCTFPVRRPCRRQASYGFMRNIAGASHMQPMCRSHAAHALRPICLRFTECSARSVEVRSTLIEVDQSPRNLAQRWPDIGLSLSFSVEAGRVWPGIGLSAESGQNLPTIGPILCRKAKNWPNFGKHWPSLVKLKSQL